MIMEISPNKNCVQTLLFPRRETNMSEGPNRTPDISVRKLESLIATEGLVETLDSIYPEEIKRRDLSRAWGQARDAIAQIRFLLNE